MTNNNQEIEELRHNELLAAIFCVCGIVVMISGIAVSAVTVSYSTYEWRGLVLYQITHFERPYMSFGGFLIFFGIVLAIISAISGTYYSIKRNKLLGKPWWKGLF
jgi:hypothetical protein